MTFDPQCCYRGCDNCDTYHKDKKPVPNGVCRTGCPTQNHKTWGDCARDAGIAIDKTSLQVR